MARHASELIKSSLAPSTRSAYDTSITQYKAFSLDISPNTPPIPASVGILLKYIAFLDRQGQSSSYISTKLSALAYIHRIKKLPDPTTDFLVLKAMSGVRKLNPSHDTRTPLTTDILDMIIKSANHLGWTPHMTLAFKAMVTLSFYAFLRPGEITRSINNIRFENVQISPVQISITFHRYKHHTGDPVLLQVLPSNTPACPVRLLNQFISFRGSQPGPLFTDGAGAPIQYTMYNRMFAAMIAFLQLPSSLTPHSARIGAATHAAKIGIPEETIKRMGRWSSSAFTKYIRIPSLTMPTSYHPS